MNRDSRNAAIALGAFALFGFAMFGIIKVSERNAERNTAPQPSAADQRLEEMGEEIDRDVQAALDQVNDTAKEGIADSEARAEELQREMEEIRQRALEQIEQSAE